MKCLLLCCDDQETSDDLRRRIRCGRATRGQGKRGRGRRLRNAANEKMMSDPRMEEMGATMPFDGKRMIYGGFIPILDR